MTTSTIAIVFSVSLLLMDGHACAQEGATQQSTSDTITALQREKLQLEIEDLKAKTSAIGLLNQPIVLTVLTLAIGGLLFGILSDKRTRKAKQLDKAIESVDEVAADLNSVFTPLFRYIRIGNDEDRQPSADLSPDRSAILADLRENIPKLFAKRLSVSTRTNAFLPRRCRHFSVGYVRLCQELGKILDVLQEVTTDKESQADVKRIQDFKNDFARAWPFRHEPTHRQLKQPFKECDDWAEMVWSRSTDLLAFTVKKIL